MSNVQSRKNILAQWPGWIHESLYRTQDTGLWTLDIGLLFMIKAIFFDFNGVIIDDERLQMAAYQGILREHGIELSENDYFSSLGMDDKTFVRAAFARANKSLTEDVLQKTLDEKTVRHRKLIENDLPLFPGVITFLKATSRHYDLGLVSMANNAGVGYVLDIAKLRPLFSIIVTADDVNICKPAPDCYRSGFEKLNQSRRDQRLLPALPNECLVIEDSPPELNQDAVRACARWA
jgi:beta-phosphoglucomutase-like phosphatase (HAD superfamily)